MPKKTWKLTEKQRVKMLDRYHKGERAAALADEYQIDITAIYGLLKRRGIPKRGTRKLPREEFANVLRMYESGISAKKIARRYGISRPVVLYSLRSIGGKVRDSHDAMRRYALNETAFDVLTPEAAYWIGVLIADGNVMRPSKCPGSGMRISLGLKASDHKHVRRFAVFVGTEKPLDFQPYRKGVGGDRMSSRIVVVSDHMAKSLAKYGFVQRKTGRVKVSLLDNNRDFWRGAIDGNASLWMDHNKYPAFSFGGSKRLIEQFVAYLRKEGLTFKAKIRRGKGRKYWRISTTGTYAIQIASLFYREGDVSLERKAILAAAFIRGSKHGPSRLSGSSSRRRLSSSRSVKTRTTRPCQRQPA